MIDPKQEVDSDRATSLASCSTALFACATDWTRSKPSKLLVTSGFNCAHFRHEYGSVDPCDMSESDYYGPSAGHHHPRDHGYSQEASPRYDSYGRHEAYPMPSGYVPPANPPAASYDPQNFPPPPTEAYYDGYGDNRAPAQHGYEEHAPRSEYEHGYGRAPPSIYDDRAYPPSSVRGHEGNQLATFDEHKARAEDRRGYEDDLRRGPPPPPSDYELGRRRNHDSRDRDYNDRYYDDRRSEYGDRDRRYSDSRDRRYNDDRRRHNSQKGRHQSPKRKKDIFGGKDGERGFGAQVLGGAAGGLLGHEFGGGLLETLGGVVVGAVGAKAVEKQYDKTQQKKDVAKTEYKRERRAQRRSSSSGYGGSRAPPRSSSRGDRSDYRDGSYSRPPRRRSGSFSRRDSRSRSWSGSRSRTPPRRRYD